MTNYTYQVTDNAAITYSENKVVITTNRMKNVFTSNLCFTIVIVPFVIFSMIYLDWFHTNLLLLLFPIFFICISIYAVKSDIKNLFKYSSASEKLIIDIKGNFQYWRGQFSFFRNFKQHYLAYNIESFKEVEVEGDENRNIYNPTMCIKSKNETIFIMHYLNEKDSILIFKDLEKWYLKNDLVDNLQLFRKSTNETSLFKNRHSLDEQTGRYFQKHKDYLIYLHHS